MNTNNIKCEHQRRLTSDKAVYDCHINEFGVCDSPAYYYCNLLRQTVSTDCCVVCPYRKKAPATLNDRYSFEMPSYTIPDEMIEMGRIQAECQKEVKEQLENSKVKFQ